VVTGLDRTEQELVARCRAGEEAAWAELFRKHAPHIALFLRGVLGRLDVDDLVQRVFVELLRSLARFRGESSLRAWLHGIAHNLAHKEIRTMVRQRQTTAAYGEVLGELEAGGSPERLAEARQQLERVAEALEALDLRFRSVWVMRELEELSVEEVAAALGEREATVRTRHHRAREKVLAALARSERRSASEPGGVAPEQGSFWRIGGQA
jgi:RNA polymerase sigma-70 factor, ECF subfamily